MMLIVFSSFCQGASCIKHAEYPLCSSYSYLCKTCYNELRKKEVNF